MYPIRYNVLSENKNVITVDHDTFHSLGEGYSPHVALHEFPEHGNTVVSTVTLSTGEVPFETMIFSNNEELDGYQNRCITYEEALEQHRKAVNVVKRKFGIEEKILKLNFRKNGKTDNNK